MSIQHGMACPHASTSVAGAQSFDHCAHDANVQLPVLARILLTIVLLLPAAVLGGFACGTLFALAWFGYALVDRETVGQLATFMLMERDQAM